MATVSTMLMLPMVIEVASMIRPTKASVGPGPGVNCDPDSGAYTVQPPSAFPPGRKNPSVAMTPPKSHSQ